MSTKTKTAKTEKKEFTLKQVFAMWKRTSKNGNSYFTGKMPGGSEIRGFYVSKKQNPKEPDIRIYTVSEKGDLSKEPYISLWCNVTENGKKYLSGKIDGKRVVGFINAKATEENKQPYFSVYWSDNEETAKAKKDEPKYEEVDKDSEIPF